MSDLVRRAEKAGSGKETPSPLSRMDTLVRQPPPVSGEAGHDAKALYQKARQEVARILEAAGRGTPFRVDGLVAAVQELVETLMAGDALLLQTTPDSENHLDLSTHMVNVAIFAVRIGQGIGYGPEGLRRLALAACLHDVGMVTVPRAVLEKPEALSDEDLAQIRHHPERSHQILQALGPEFSWVATVALQEQEREDGSGYPRGLRGDQIHEYAKVIGLADVYESLTHSRPYRSMLVPYDIEEIARSMEREFPGHLLQAMRRALSPYLAGTPVRLPPMDQPEPTEEKETQEIPRMTPASTAPAVPEIAPQDAEAERREDVLYCKAREEVARCVEAVAQGKATDLDALEAVAREIVEFLATGDALLVRALAGGETHLDLPRHLVNVAVLAVKIGQGIGYRLEDLRRLALAACLHDVGMVIVPRAVLEKRRALSPEELALIRQHPDRSFQMLQVLGPDYKWLATIAHQEQEREDGSGYPRGLRGDQIHEYAKVIGLADVYESLTHSRPYQRLRIPFEAVKEIMSAERHKFPGQILRGLIQGLSTFPVGSLVRMNSREIARVVASNPALPLRPVVEILTGPTGGPLATPRRVDLAQNTLMYIMDGASAEEVGAIRSD